MIRSRCDREEDTEVIRPEKGQSPERINNNGDGLYKKGVRSIPTDEV